MTFEQHYATLNAAMLARQTDLAREAETKAEIARRNSRDNWELLMDSHKERDTLRAKLEAAEADVRALAEALRQALIEEGYHMSRNMEDKATKALSRPTVRKILEGT